IRHSYRRHDVVPSRRPEGVTVAMARILVSEADPDVRRLLIVLVERLGHEAIVLDPDVVVPPRADLMLLEPDSPACLEEARLARAYFPELPVLCLNVLP